MTISYVIKDDNILFYFLKNSMKIQIYISYCNVKCFLPELSSVNLTLRLLFVGTINCGIIFFFFLYKLLHNLW
jgi:type III secretory pathway component EscU